MRKKVVISLIIIGIIIIAACFYMYLNHIWIFDKYRNADISPSSLMQDLQQNLDFLSYYNMENEEVVEKYKDIILDNISEFSVITSFIDIEAFEIGIFKVKSKEYIDGLRKVLEKRAENIASIYHSYIYAQEQIAKDYEIKVYNNVVILIIHKNKEKVIKYIENSIV